MRSRICSHVFWGLAVAVASSAQQLQVGLLPPSPNVALPADAVTVLSLSAVVPAAGTLTSATFAYSRFPCPVAVKIKFFRSEFAFQFLHFLAERGPFDVTQAIQTVPLSPPVAVLPGDSLAITRLSDCGTPLEQTPPLPEDPFPELIYFDRDVSQDTNLAGTKLIGGATLALAAFGERDPFPRRIIPVVFKGPGAAGSQLRTEALIHNPTANFISGRLDFPYASVFLPGYTVDYSLGPYETQSVSLPGFGSVDIIPAIGPAAVALVHVFNDAGPAGTVGFVESDVPTSEALGTGERGVLLGPADTDNFRFNIGFRSLGPATLLVNARSHDGALVATATVSVGRFLQRSAQDLLKIPLQPGMTFTVEVTTGAAVVYGATVDNRTNDPSFQLARHIGS